MKLRDAFERACVPRAKSLALEHFGEHGEAELSKARAGSRRPTWGLLEAAFDADPEALFAWVATRYGVKVERPASPLATQLELFGAEIHSLNERLTELTELARAQERAGMARVVHGERERARR